MSISKIRTFSVTLLDGMVDKGICIGRQIANKKYELFKPDYKTVIGTYNLKSTNIKGVFLMEVPFKGKIVVYQLNTMAIDIWR